MSRTQNESNFFITCFHRDHDLLAVLKKVIDFFHLNIIFICIRERAIEILTGIEDSEITIDETVYTDVDSLEPCHDGYFQVKEKRICKIPAKYHDDFNKIKNRVLEKQEGKYFKIDCNDVYQTNLVNKVRQESLRLSSRYNDIHVTRKSKVTCISGLSHSDHTENKQWLLVKQKKKNLTGRAIKKKYSKLILKRLNSRLNFDFKRCNASSSVKKETKKSENTKKAKCYVSKKSDRKRSVTECSAKWQKAPAAKRSRGFLTLDTINNARLYDNPQWYYYALSYKDATDGPSTVLGRGKRIKDTDHNVNLPATAVRDEYNKNIIPRKTRRRSRSLENQRPHSSGDENAGQKKFCKEYEGKSKTFLYFGKENDVLSLKLDKDKKHGEPDGDRPSRLRERTNIPFKRQRRPSQDHTSWLRDRTHLPFSQQPVPRQEYHVYPGNRGKKKRGGSGLFSSGSRRQDQRQAPVQVADGSNETGPQDQVVTSTVTVYRQNQFLQLPPPTCNVMSYAHEQALTLRLHGMSNRSRHGRAPPPPKHPQYTEPSARLASYAHWPRETRQDPNTMSNYGFFHTGRVDLVRCFQCGIGLKDWSEPDEPLFEHIKHAPDCPFLLKLLGPELLAAYKVNLVPGSAQPTEARPPPVEAPGTDEGATGGAPAAIRHPEYADMSARLRTFDSNWSRNQSQSPLEVAEAGFYYTGEGDVCRCFHCDGGLTRWDPQDDPWVEHAKWFPACPFVRQVRGNEYVNLIQQAIASTDDEEPNRATENALANLNITTAPDPMTTPAAASAIEMGYSRNAVALAVHELIAKGKTDFSASDIVDLLTEKQDRGEALPTDSPSSFPQRNEEPPEPLDDKVTLERDNERLNNILKCIRCEERFANMLFIPCTHHKLCEECSEGVTMCPACGRTIEKKVKTYMS